MTTIISVEDIDRFMILDKYTESIINGNVKIISESKYLKFSTYKIIEIINKNNKPLLIKFLEHIKEKYISEAKYLLKKAKDFLDIDNHGYESFYSYNDDDYNSESREEAYDLFKQRNPDLSLLSNDEIERHKKYVGLLSEVRDKKYEDAINNIHTELLNSFSNSLDGLEEFIDKYYVDGKFDYSEFDDKYDPILCSIIKDHNDNYLSESFVKNLHLKTFQFCYKIIEFFDNCLKQFINSLLNYKPIEICDYDDLSSYLFNDIIEDWHGYVIYSVIRHYADLGDDESMTRLAKRMIKFQLTMDEGLKLLEKSFNSIVEDLNVVVTLKRKRECEE